jgi:hypothetical protein
MPQPKPILQCSGKWGHGKWGQVFIINDSYPDNQRNAIALNLRNINCLMPLPIGPNGNKSTIYQNAIAIQAPLGNDGACPLTRHSVPAIAPGA